MANKDGFYFSETVGFQPETKKPAKKQKGENKDGKEKGKDSNKKQKN